MLFHGNPGTGKTLAAEAIAGQLRKKILTTNMSKISSKWVGESEQNVIELFDTYNTIYEQVDNAPILLLNEADQLLTKRIKDPDRHNDIVHNTLQNLFLEAFENFRGILIATTNLKANLDSAFDRRFHVKIEFPQPSFEELIKLWELHLLPSIPGSEHISTEQLARSFSLTGGQIKNIVQNACVEAASRSHDRQYLQMQDILKYCNYESDTSQKSRKIAGF